LFRPFTTIEVCDLPFTLESASSAVKSLRTCLNETIGMSDFVVPNDISCSDQVFALDFHPNGDHLATGIIDGSVEIWQYGGGPEGNKNLLRVKNHTASCRGLKFDEHGSRLYTISSDKSLRGLDESGTETFALNHAHAAAINRIELIGDSLLTTGDDSGCVKLWDLRTIGADANAAMEWKVHEDFVSGLAYNLSTDCLVSTSGDATFAVYDLRNPSQMFRSEQVSSELHCVQVMAHGEAVMFGTENAEVLVYRWDRWNECADRIVGHPQAVDCMWKMDETVAVTGSSDGLLRVVSLLPNKVLGVVGDHEEFPVEGMCASRDGRLLGSFAHDEVVRFWDLAAALYELGGAGDTVDGYQRGQGKGDSLANSV
jgi:WD40 repeat protein